MSRGGAAPRALLIAAGLAGLGCGREGPPPAPPASWLAEPLAAVRTSTLSAGPHDPPPEIANPYADAPGARADGRQLYQAFNCAGCHGGAGGGGIGPPLADADWIYGGSDANIYASIIQGRPNGMPAFGPAMSGEAVWKLAAYVKSLGHGTGENQDE
ncbi:MAG TPA: c-type cytochrome [Gemmatimonadales bacterium]|nr:c-type cytochrome [Gemmatimonadales bacterium]